MELCSQSAHVELESLSQSQRRGPNSRMDGLSLITLMMMIWPVYYRTHDKDCPNFIIMMMMYPPHSLLLLGCPTSFLTGVEESSSPVISSEGTNCKAN